MATASNPFPTRSAQTSPTAANLPKPPIVSRGRTEQNKNGPHVDPCYFSPAGGERTEVIGISPGFGPHLYCSTCSSRGFIRRNSLQFHSSQRRTSRVQLLFQRRRRKKEKRERSRGAAAERDFIKRAPTWLSFGKSRSITQTPQSQWLHTCITSVKP